MKAAVAPMERSTITPAGGSGAGFTYSDDNGVNIPGEQCIQWPFG